jgi:transposase
LYKERDEEAREIYLKRVSHYGPNRRVYVDEVGIDRYYGRSYAWAPRGEKVIGEVPGHHFLRTSIVAGKCKGQPLCAHFQYTGTMNRALFEQWFKEQLLKEVKVGSVIIMDNASFHSKKALKKLVRGTGRKLLFLPAYSPDLNPIEKEWANLKKSLDLNASNYASLDDALLDYFKVH